MIPKDLGQRRPVKQWKAYYFCPPPPPTLDSVFIVIVRVRMEVLGCTYREKESYLKSKHCDLKEEQGERHDIHYIDYYKAHPKRLCSSFKAIDIFLSGLMQVFWGCQFNF